MAETIELRARDGHVLSCWRATPTRERKGGIVILHAVYGATSHLAEVCDRYADDGYEAIAPALFDRVSRGSVFPYSRDGADAGIAAYAALTDEQIFADVDACAKALRARGKVAISGFCTGGTWAWRAASARNFDAQVNFYGSHVPAYIDLQPRCPTLMHYGDSDTIMPIDQVNAIARAHPDVRVEIYPGSGHAFFNPEQATHHREAAARAWTLSIDFLNEHLGGD